MATFIPSTPLTQAILGVNGLDTDVSDAVSYISKAYRLLILADRNFRGFDKAEVNGDPSAYHHEPTFAQSLGTNQKVHRQQINKPVDTDPTAYKFQKSPTGKYDKAHRRNADGTLKPTPELSGPIDYRFEEANKRVARSFQKDYVAIIDLDHDPERHVKKKYQSLLLPFTPKSLKYTVDSNFVPIATMGRNNPHYHFTGSEDTLEFTIDWHSYQNHREDVIFFCRWVESLSKGDGYAQIPHRVKLAWGQDSVMFQDDIWIVTNASYDMMQFVDSYNDTKDRSAFTRVGLLPQQAAQSIILKRLSTENRFTEDIIGKYRFIDTANVATF